VSGYLEFKNVTKRFGEFTAVSSVSFDIDRGEFFSLLGPSGSGKTTLLRMTAGFEEPTEGDIFLEGKSIVNVPPYKRPVNMVFQDLALFPHMNVYKNIAFGLEMMKTPKTEIKKRVREILEVVRLAGYENRRIGQLSGGEQQRTALARALVPNPSVLLLDEPLANLDRRLRDEMQIELKELHRKVGVTFLYVTHDQESALTMSDRIGIMHNGKIEQIGTVYEIYHKPNTLFIANFIGDTNIIDCKIRKISDNELELEDSNLTYFMPATVSSLRENDKVYLSLRPERIVVGSDAKNLQNNFVGTIDELIFQGVITRIAVRLSNGREIVVKATGVVKEKVGDEVTIGWKGEECKLVL